MKYYDLERRKWPDTEYRSFRQARDIIRKWNKKYGTKVQVQEGAGNWFDPEINTIQLSYYGVECLTIAHEFAHALDYHQRGWALYHRWHGKYHQQLVNTLLTT
jgi:hypothetical protein